MSIVEGPSLEILRNPDSQEQALNHRHEWAEDIVAGLLCNGVRRDEIKIITYVQSNTMQISVRGVVRYEHRIIYSSPFRS